MTGSWPSIAYLVWRYKSTFLLPNGVSLTYSFSAACGATLIARDTLMTAAHCVPATVSFTYAGSKYTYPVTTNSYYPTQASMFEAYLGLQDKTSISFSGTYSAPTVKVDISKVIMHENYNSVTFTNDIALLFLTSNVTLNQNIQIGIFCFDYLSRSDKRLLSYICPTFKYFLCVKCCNCK